MEKDFNQNQTDMFSAFIGLLADEVAKRIQPATIIQEKRERIKLKGIRGIASYLGVSIVTAQRMKDKGLLPVYWTGNKLYGYSDEVEDGIKTKGEGDK